MTNFFIFLMTSFLLRKFYEITLFSQRSVPRRSHQKCSISQTYRKSVFSCKVCEFFRSTYFVECFWTAASDVLVANPCDTYNHRFSDCWHFEEVVLLKTWFCENTNKFKWKHMQRSRFLHLQLYLKTTLTPALHCEFQPNGSFNTCFWKVLADF